MTKLHKRICRGHIIPYEKYDDYMAYVETIAPPISAFKPVPLSQSARPLDSGLLNELSKPAGVSYAKIGHWWEMQ